MLSHHVFHAANFLQQMVNHSLRSLRIDKFGALQCCTLTHSEIAYSFNQLCQLSHAPTTAHWRSTKHVLHYLKDTIYHGLSTTPKDH